LPGLAASCRNAVTGNVTLALFPGPICQTRENLSIVRTIPDQRGGTAGPVADMNDRIEQLEIKVAFLEQANTQLSEELFRHRLQMEALQLQLQALTGRFEASLAAPSTYSLEDDKPPHY
jgi:uncharacterized coiled-coil protein SlyX